MPPRAFTSKIGDRIVVNEQFPFLPSFEPSSLLEREKSDCKIRDLSERNRRSLNLILFVILPFFRDSRCPRNEKCRECDVKESEAGQFYFILFIYIFFFVLQTASSP